MQNLYQSHWKEDAATMQKLRKYLTAISDKGSKEYIPVEDRVAVFDVDGTLVSENDPHYIVALLWMYAVLEDKRWTPSAANRKLAESFRQSLTQGTPFECEDYGQLLQVQEERYLGMTADQYSQYVNAWLATQPSRFFGPMVQVVKRLQAAQFTVFLVSASDREFMRCLCSKVLNIPPSNIIGSDVCYQVKEGQAVHGTFLSECDGEAKVVAIQREIGKQPVLAFGNSSGDYAMFRYTLLRNPYPAAVFCLTDKKLPEAAWNRISVSEEWSE